MKAQNIILKNYRKFLKCGIYRCQIICDNDDFRKLFAFSKTSAYTHYSLKTALKYRDEYDVSIQINST